jgi:hypothetical protein
MSGRKEVDTGCQADSGLTMSGKQAEGMLCHTGRGHRTSGREHETSYSQRAPDVRQAGRQAEGCPKAAGQEREARVSTPFPNVKHPEEADPRSEHRSVLPGERGVTA